jgi:hypothetical protein
MQRCRHFWKDSRDRGQPASPDPSRCGSAVQSEEDAAGWQHEVVADGDWLAFNTVPPTTSLADMPQDLLANAHARMTVLISGG